MNATYASDGHVETYTYSVDDYLETVSIAVKDSGGVLGASKLSVGRTNDVLGRMTGTTEYKSDGIAVLSTRAITYDGDNRITDETDYTYATGTDANNNPVSYTYRSVIKNHYKAWDATAADYIGTDQGVLVHSKNVQDTSTDGGSHWLDPVTTNSNYNYVWWSSAKISNVKINGTDPSNANADAWKPGVAAYSYDNAGNLIKVQDGGIIDAANNTNGINRTVTYLNNVFGEIMVRSETNVVSLHDIVGAHRNFFYLNGLAIGDAGNDQLPSEIDYAEQLATDRFQAKFAGSTFNTDAATPIVGVNANFDNSYEAYSASSVSQSRSNYTVSIGDSLQSIAASAWGDSSLWYVIADANGLGAGTTLLAGQTLTIPGNVFNVHNSSGIFKPYNPSDTQGNTNPTLPSEPQPPAQKGCGSIGDTLALIVSTAVDIVVSYFFGSLPGAVAGDLAYQGIEIAAGNQSRINWGEVGASALTAVIEYGAGLSGPPGVQSAIKGAKAFGQAVIHGIERNVIRQGVNMALGLQKKFDWVGLAVSGVEAGAAYEVKAWSEHHIQGGGKGSGAILSRGEAYVARSLLTGAAGLLANAATRSALTGQDFSKSLREALPAAIGSTIGTMIGDSVVGAVEEHRARAAAERAAAKSDPATAAGLSSGGIWLSGAEKFAPGIGVDMSKLPALTLDLGDLEAGGAGYVSNGGYASDGYPSGHNRVLRSNTVRGGNETNWVAGGEGGDYLDIGSRRDGLPLGGNGSVADTSTYSPVTFISVERKSPSYIEATWTEASGKTYSRGFMQPENSNYLTEYDNSSVWTVIPGVDGGADIPGTKIPWQAWDTAADTVGTFPHFDLNNTPMPMTQQFSEQGVLATFDAQYSDAQYGKYGETHLVQGRSAFAQYWGDVGHDIARGFSSAWRQFASDFHPRSPLDLARSLRFGGLGIGIDSLNLVLAPAATGFGGLMRNTTGFKDNYDGVAIQALAENRAKHPSILDPNYVASAQEKRDLLGNIVVTVVTMKAPMGATVAEGTIVRGEGAYGELVGTLDDGFQAHHLNQNAIFSSVIPKDEGFAVGIRGNAFTGWGTPHYEFHSSMEKFLDSYRKDGELFGELPTNAEYGDAVTKALQNSGLSRTEAQRLSDLAKQNRDAFRLSPDATIPRIPRKIYQSGGN